MFLKSIKNTNIIMLLYSGCFNGREKGCVFGIMKTGIIACQPDTYF